MKQAGSKQLAARVLSARPVLCASAHPRQLDSPADRPGDAGGRDAGREGQDWANGWSSRTLRRRCECCDACNGCCPRVADAIFAALGSLGCCAVDLGGGRGAQCLRQAPADWGRGRAWGLDQGRVRRLVTRVPDDDIPRLSRCALAPCRVPADAGGACAPPPPTASDRRVGVPDRPWMSLCALTRPERCRVPPAHGCSHTQPVFRVWLPTARPAEPAARRHLLLHAAHCMVPCTCCCSPPDRQPVARSRDAQPSFAQPLFNFVSRAPALGVRAAAAQCMRSLDPKQQAAETRGSSAVSLWVSDIASDRSSRVNLETCLHCTCALCALGLGSLSIAAENADDDSSQQPAAGATTSRAKTDSGLRTYPASCHPARRSPYTPDTLRCTSASGSRNTGGRHTVVLQVRMARAACSELKANTKA